MNDIPTDGSSHNPVDIQDVESQIQNLRERVEATNKEITDTNKSFAESADALETAIQTDISAIDEIASDLESADTEAEQELDALLLEQAEDIADDSE